MRLPLCLLVLSAIAGASAQAFDEDYREPINGTKLHFRVRGEDRANPYLLILHGGPGGSAIEFYPWGRRLESKLNVVYLDQRGSGLSEPVKFKDREHPTAAESKGFDVETFLHDIEGVRKRLHIKSWYVLGHSFGGLLATEYVASFGEYVRGFIDMDGLVSVPMIDQEWLNYAEAAIAKTALAGDPEDRARIADVRANIAALRKASQSRRDAEIGSKVLDKIWPERIRDRQAGANEYDQLIDKEALQRYGIAPTAMGTPGIGAAFNVNDSLYSREVISLYGDVHSPTLIISGLQDPIIPPRSLEIPHRMIKGSEIIFIDQADHEVFKQQPEKTASAVLGFVERVEGHQGCHP